MQVSTSSLLPMTVGLDLGDRRSRYCLRSSTAIVEEGFLPMSRGGLRRGLKRLLKLGAERVVLEVGSQSAWVSRMANELGLKAVVANPRRVRLITHDVFKTDQRDARILADMGQIRPELLSPIEHRGEQAQRDLVVLRTRANLVEGRTALVNEVRQRLKSLGVRIPACSPEAFPKRAEPELPEQLKDTLQGTLALITHFTTSWAPSARTVTCDDTACASPGREERQRRNERSWRWPESWLYCCCPCGERGRSTSLCAIASASKPRPAELGHLEHDL